MAKKAEVIITCDASTVKRVLEGINNEIAKTNQRRQQLQQKQQQGIRLTKQEERELQSLVKYENALAERQQKVTGEMRKFNDVIRDLAGSKLKDLKKALQEGKNALNNMSAKDPKRQQLVADLKRIQTQIEKNTGAIKAQGNAFATTAKNLATYMIGFAGFNKIKGLVEGVFQSNLKLSDSLADIRKVSGLAMSDINQLYRNIAAIDSRNTIETLNQLAYTGAKLGIGQNYGVEGLTGFVKAAEQVQMALGEDMGEKALPELAKMTEVMGLIEKYGVEQSMQKAASAIFQLGATSTATGTNIVEFSKRLYGLANVSRISADELLAIGSASDAMGLMPEVAATAFNKLFTAVQKNHNMIEKTLGLQPGLIKNYYTQGKTMEAIVKIFEKMNETGNLNLLGNVFKDLGSDGARLVNVMATMSDRVDILRKHLETSRDAFKEGEAVIGEYMIQNQTAQALMERAANLWEKAFTNPEGVDMVKQMAQAWYDVSKQMTQSEALMGSLRTSIDYIAASIGVLIRLLPALIRLGTIMAVTFGLKQAVLGVGALITSMRTLYRDVVLATGAVGKFTTIMKSNAFFFVASAITTVVTLMNDYAKAAQEAAKRETERQAKLKAAFEDSKEAVENSVRPLEGYKRALDEANLSEKQKMQLVKDFKNSYQDYIDYLGIEVNTALDLAKAYGMVVKVMKQKKAVEERENYRTQQNGQNRMDRIAAQAQAEAEARSLGIEGINKDFLEGTQNVRRGGYNVQRGSDAVVLDILRRRYGNNIGMSARGQVYRIETIDKNLPVSANNQRITNIDVDVSGLRKAVSSYISSYRTETKTNREIDEMFNTEYADIDLKNFNLDEFNRRVQEARWKRKGTLDNEKPDKEALKAAKKAAQEAKQAARKELKDAQTETNAIIAKVEEWYTLQQTAVTDAFNEGKITEREMTLINRQLEGAKNQALAAARRSLSGQDTQSWESFKTQIGALMVDQSDWSKELLDAIQTTNMEALRNALMKFDGKKSLDQWGFTSTAFRDGLNKNAAKNEAKVNELTAKAREELDKLLLRYDYFQQASRAFANNLIQIGALGTTAEQMANGMNGVATAQQTQEAAQSLMASMLRQGASVYAVEPTNPQAVATMLQQMSAQPGGQEGEHARWFDLFPEVKDWMENPEAHRKELEQIFNVMLTAEQDYYQKRKQSYQTAKTEQENRFRAAGFTDQEEQQQTALSNQAKQQDAGIGASFWQQQGLGSIAQDPEVLAIQNRIYWRNEEVKAAEARLQALKAQQEEEVQALRDAHASKEEIQQLESEQAAARMGFEDLLKERQTALFEQEVNLSTKVAQELQKRVQTVNNLIKPVTTFTEAAGRKIGDMVFNMESESATWEELWKNMALAVGESVIQMGAQYAQNLIMQQAMNKASEAEAVADAGVKVTAGIAAGSAKTIGTLGWWGIPLIAVISSLLMGLLQSALSTKSARDGSAGASSTAATKTRLVSGMLTYDEGNVREVIGSDGRVYRAQEQPQLPEGVSVVSQPIATTVNGQPSLVGEQGPEIVIGRRTSKAIMMNDPELLYRIAQYDRNGGRQALPVLRAYDSGNVGAIGDGSSRDSAAFTQEPSPQGNDLASRIDRQNALMEQMIYYLQHPVAPEIAMLGDNGLRRKMQQADRFMQRYE